MPDYIIEGIFVRKNGILTWPIIADKQVVGGKSFSVNDESTTNGLGFGPHHLSVMANARRTSVGKIKKRAHSHFYHF
jgi:hypothetical protein